MIEVLVRLAGDDGEGGLGGIARFRGRLEAAAKGGVFGLAIRPGGLGGVVIDRRRLQARQLELMGEVVLRDDLDPVGAFRVAQVFL